MNLAEKIEAPNAPESGVSFTAHDRPLHKRERLIVAHAFHKFRESRSPLDGSIKRVESSVSGGCSVCHSSIAAGETAFLPRSRVRGGMHLRCTPTPSGPGVMSGDAAFDLRMQKDERMRRGRARSACGDAAVELLGEEEALGTLNHLELGAVSEDE